MVPATQTTNANKYSGTFVGSDDACRIQQSATCYTGWRGICVIDKPSSGNGLELEANKLFPDHYIDINAHPVALIKATGHS